LRLKSASADLKTNNHNGIKHTLTFQKPGKRVKNKVSLKHYFNKKINKNAI